MLVGVAFNDERFFNVEDGMNTMYELTPNTIVVCEDTKLKKFLANTIQETCEGKHRRNWYEMRVENKNKTASLYSCRAKLVYLPTTELIVDGEQRILITVEAPFVLTADAPEDIWFATRDFKSNKISVVPFTRYRGYENKWKEGKFAVYKHVISGAYGELGRYAAISEREIG